MRRYTELLATVWAISVIATVIALWQPPVLRTARAQTTAGPNVYTLTIGASATLAAIPANPTRRALQICNGHATQTATFTWGTVTPVSLTTGLVLAAGNVATSCYITPGAITSGLGAQINLIASGASTPVTAFEF